MLSPPRHFQTFQTTETIYLNYLFSGKINPIEFKKKKKKKKKKTKKKTKQVKKKKQKKKKKTTTQKKPKLN
jgi:mannitol-specific phosphotransferase system IIBC component